MLSLLMSAATSVECGKVIRTLFQAFAWFSDILAEQAETFWSLFSVDMESALQVQPPEAWDAFALFRLLNDYLRNHGKHGPCFTAAKPAMKHVLETLRNGRFHQHLAEVFAHRVVNYMEITESNISQSLANAIPKEKWDPKG